MDMRKMGRGFSIHTVLMLATVLSFLAATMTALYMTSLNFTTGFNNGDVASREAEAGVTELITRLVDNPLYGTHGEELLGTVTEGVDLSRAAVDRDTYHVITFNPTSTFPYSVNRENASVAPDSVFGRQVPVGSIHVTSTGFCRGQYRTIEAVLEHPPYPYGIATKGALVSHGSVRVVGTTTVANSGDPTYQPDRPGHVVCNSDQSPAVNITGANTYVSGQIRAVGPIVVPASATVLGGLLPDSTPLQLPVLDFAPFAPTSDFREVAQEDEWNVGHLNTAYVRTNGNIHYHHGLTMEKGLLRVIHGNVTIDEFLNGEGAILCDGNLTINGGASQLLGSNWLALCAKGDIIIEGGEKNIRGLVYCEGSLTAHHVVIAGASVVNPPPTSTAPGSTTLEQVTFVADASAAVHSMNISLSPGPSVSPSGPIPYGTRVNNGVIDVTDNLGGGGVTRAQAQTSLDILMNTDMLAHRLTIGPYDPNQPPFNQASAQNSLNMLRQLNVLAYAVIDANEGVNGSPPPNDPNTPQDETNDYWVARQSAAMTAYSDFRGEAQNAFMDFVGNAPDQDGSVVLDPANPTKEILFDMNQFLPRSEKYRVGYWHLHPRLLK